MHLLIHSTIIRAAIIGRSAQLYAGSLKEIFQSNEEEFIAMELTAEAVGGGRSGMRCSGRVSGLITVALFVLKR